jgi:hypothetical protein
MTSPNGTSRSEPGASRRAHSAAASAVPSGTSTCRDGTTGPPALDPATPAASEALPALVPRSRGMSRQRSRTTRRRTDCARRHRSPTQRLTARQQVLGVRASFATHPNIKEWADTVSRNPARIPPDFAGSAAVPAAKERFRRHVAPGWPGWPTGRDVLVLREQ